MELCITINGMDYVANVLFGLAFVDRLNPDGTRGENEFVLLCPCKNEDDAWNYLYDRLYGLVPDTFEEQNEHDA